MVGGQHGSATLGLLDLELDLLQLVYRRLKLRDRTSLFSASKALLQLGEADPWCRQQLECLTLDVYSRPLHTPSLLLWLRRRSGHIKRLRIDAEGPCRRPRSFTAVLLLGALAGSGVASLEWESLTPADLDAWVLLLPRLQFLSVTCSQRLTVSPALAHLTSLTALRLAQQEEEEWGEGRQGEGEGEGAAAAAPLHLEGPCLPPSLRSLELWRFRQLPEAVGLATQLQRLTVSAGHDGGSLDADSLQHLASLSHLTYLSLRSCDLRQLPPQLTALSRLEALDLSRNRLVCGSGGDAALAPLAALPALRRLFLQGCIASIPSAGLTLHLPQGIQALNLSSNQHLLDASPATCSTLRQLSMSLLLAQRDPQRLAAAMPELQELYLTHPALDLQPAESQRLLREGAPAVLESLRRAPALQRVLISRELAAALAGKGREAAAVAEWAAQLQGLEVVLGGWFGEGHLEMERMPRWDNVDA